jgi:hypothetical protein
MDYQLLKLTKLNFILNKKIQKNYIVLKNFQWILFVNSSFDDNVCIN